MKIIPTISVSDHVSSLMATFAKSVSVPPGTSIPPLPDTPCLVEAKSNGMSFVIEIQPSPDLLTWMAVVKGLA